MRFQVTKEEDGLLLRSVIFHRLHPSTKLLRSLKFRPDGILVNGAHATVRRVLHEGDEVTLATEDDTSPSYLLPVDLPLSILYEDEALVVPSKPADMPTHPSHDHREDTVANALAYRYRAMDLPFVFRPINRLDRNTSGLLLVARNRLSAARLAESMRKGEIQKEYLAVVEGHPEEEEGIIDRPLHRTAASIIVREVCAPDAPDADEARTAYRVLARSEAHALVKVRPLTGRTHQIRVHFASIGHPLVGDDLYGTVSPLLARHALHARTLSFPHPETGERMTFSAPLPPDMDELVKTLFPEVLC